MKKILITGASGLTGSHIAEYFSNMGEDCCCLVREKSDIDFLLKRNLEIRNGDVSDLDSLNDAFKNIDLVIHTAAKVGDWGSYEEFYETNVTGTLNVLENSLKHGIKEVIITGSISCYGEESNQKIKTEKDDYNPHYKYLLDRVFPSGMNYYRDTKTEANRKAKEFAKKFGMNLIIINPGWIYGEREFSSGFYEYLKSISEGLRFAPGSKKNKFHSIYVRDLSKIFYLAYQKRMKGINEFLAVSEIAEYQHKIFDSLTTEAGLKKAIRLPKFIMYPPAFLIELLYHLFKIKNAPLLTRARVNMFYDNIEYSPDKIIKELGFKSDYTFEESIKRTIQWYIDNKLLEQKGEIMKNTRYLIGHRRSFYNLMIPVRAFIHFIIEIIKGKFPTKNFGRFLKRLLFFLSKMKDNKYVKNGKYIKLNLYVPAFPSKAFFKACRKVEVSYEKMPCISVLLSVTSACRYNCEHCYQKLDRGKDVDIGLLSDVVKELDRKGVAFFNIEGGEPFLLFDRLKIICNSISVGEIWVNSTGDGMTEEKLIDLKKLGVKGIMFSIHSDRKNEINEFFKKDDAWDKLIAGIQLCHNTGLETAANTCLLKPDFYNGKFHSIMDLTKELGISTIQLIKPKPSGGWLDTHHQFTQEDLKYVEDMVHDYNNKKEFKDYPFIAAQIIDERSDMFGCTAGGTDRFYINAKGDVQPCEFLNISYGNIQQEEFNTIYDRMRTGFEKAGSNWICETCSGHIHEVVIENDIDVLPLSKERSEEIIKNWDRGPEPDFYNKVREI